MPSRDLLEVNRCHQCRNSQGSNENMQSRGNYYRQVDARKPSSYHFCCSKNLPVAQVSSGLCLTRAAPCSPVCLMPRHGETLVLLLYTGTNTRRKTKAGQFQCAAYSLPWFSRIDVDLGKARYPEISRSRERWTCIIRTTIFDVPSPYPGNSASKVVEICLCLPFVGAGDPKLTCYSDISNTIDLLEHECATISNQKRYID